MLLGDVLSELEAAPGHPEAAMVGPADEPPVQDERRPGTIRRREIDVCRPVAAPVISN